MGHIVTLTTAIRLFQVSSTPQCFPKFHQANTERELYEEGHGFSKLQHGLRWPEMNQVGSDYRAALPSFHSDFGGNTGRKIISRVFDEYFLLESHVLALSFE